MAGKTTRIYVLRNNYKPVSWQLRNNALIDAGENKGLRQIVFIKGGHSIFKDDYERGITLKPQEIWFDDGTLIVNGHDTLKIKYVESHPDFNVKYKLDDPEADAIVKLRKFKQKRQVEDELAKLESFDALLEALRRKDEVTLHLTPAQKELRCYEEANKDADRVLKAISDPKNTTRYFVALALSKGILRLNTAKSAILWGDNEELILQLPLGQKPANVMAEFLFDPKNEGTLEELVKRVGALDKKKEVTKKNVTKK